MQGAILIIGSLLWDSLDKRKEWRNQRLQIDKKEYVSAPLVYGRRSRSRGNTFTMTLDTDVSIGQAVLVPFIAPTTRVEDLFIEAEYLWQAEQPGVKKGKLGASWGCVGAQFRNVSGSWQESWRRYFCEKTISAITPVNASGLLVVPWPLKVSGMPAEVDFILATATLKEHDRPTIETVSDAWIEQSANHERYFFENVRLGVRTEADVAIWKYIEEKAPSWLGSSRYSEAIKILKEEASLDN